MSQKWRVQLSPFQDNFAKKKLTDPLLWYQFYRFRYRFEQTKPDCCVYYGAYMYHATDLTCLCLCDLIWFGKDAVPFTGRKMHWTSGRDELHVSTLPFSWCSKTDALKLRVSYVEAHDDPINYSITDWSVLLVSNLDFSSRQTFVSISPVIIWEL